MNFFFFYLSKYWGFAKHLLFNNIWKHLLFVIKKTSKFYQEMTIFWNIFLRITYLNIIWSLLIINFFFFFLSKRWGFAKHLLFNNIWKYLLFIIKKTWKFYREMTIFLNNFVYNTFKYVFVLLSISFSFTFLNVEE